MKSRRSGFTLAKLLIFAVALLFIVVIAIVFVVAAGRPPTPTTSGIAIPPPNSAVTTSSQTRGPVPADVQVPNAGSTGTQDVAVPQLQAAASPSGASQYRSFSIRVQNVAYSPNTVAVNRGDVVDLEITAVDGVYGFTQADYGLNVAIAQGKTQRVQFLANMTGKFSFYCATCGGPQKGPVGYLIVK